MMPWSVFEKLQFSNTLQSFSKRAAESMPRPAGEGTEYGHSSDVDYTKSPKDATAETGRAVCEAVVDYTLRFIDEFMQFSF